MTLIINGKPEQADDGTTLAELVSRLGLGSGRIAVERNGQVVRRPDYSATRLADGDTLEIVTLVGGG